jgi:hypothetical protein
MYSTECVLKAGMGSARINETCESELFDPSESLNVGMFKQVKDKIGWNNDKSMDRIVDDFMFVDVSGHGEF